MTTVELIHTLCTIAIKAHSPNPSPVDIKHELAALPLDLLQSVQADSFEEEVTINTKPTDEPAG